MVPAMDGDDLSARRDDHFGLALVQLNRARDVDCLPSQKAGLNEGKPMAEEIITLRLTRPEVLALEKAADTGLRVIEALGLVKNLGLTEAALRKLREAR